MAITANDVKNLREMTGAGMLDCKNALNEANGDMERAVDILRTKGVAKADKRAGRVANQGLVAIKTNAEKTLAAVVEINCETDFVSRGDDFKALVDGTLDALLASDVTTIEQARALALASGGTVQEGVTAIVAKTGENTDFRRFERYAAPANGYISDYIHMGGKIGVLCEMTVGKAGTTQKPAFQELALNLCLQIAAMNPIAVSESDIPQSVINREKAIYAEQAAQTGKPANIIENIVKGKLAKWYGDVVLLKQEFFNDGDKHRKMEQIVKDVGKELGDEIVVRRFSRFALGEGLAKKESDLAAEVADMIK